MAVNMTESERNMVRANAISVLKKLLAGSFVILFVGICAYISLIILMQFI